MAAFDMAAVLVRGFDAQGVGAHVGQNDFFKRSGTGFERGLDRGAVGDHLVGVEADRREAPEQSGGEFAHQRHARGTAHQQDLIEVADANPCIAQGAFNRCAQAFQQRCVELGHFLLSDGLHPLLAIDPQSELGAVVLAQGFAHTFGFAAQGLQYAVGGWETVGITLAVDEVFQQQGVEVFATEEVVTGTGTYFHYAVEQFDDRHVKGAAA